MIDGESAPQKVYKLTEEALRSLIDESYRNGVIGGYQTLHEAMAAKFKDEDFENEEQAKGFGHCVKVMEFLMSAGATKMAESKNKNV